MFIFYSQILCMQSSIRAAKKINRYYYSKMPATAITRVLISKYRHCHVMYILTFNDALVKLQWCRIYHRISSFGFIIHKVLADKQFCEPHLYMAYTEFMGKTALQARKPNQLNYCFLTKSVFSRQRIGGLQDVFNHGVDLQMPLSERPYRALTADWAQFV